MKKTLLLIIIFFAGKLLALNIDPKNFDYEDLYNKTSNIEWIKKNLDIRYCLYKENYTFTAFKNSMH